MVMISKKEMNEIKDKLIKEHGAYCAYCHAPLFPSNTSLNHYYPVSLFPEKANDKDNLVLLCKQCNIRKSNNSPIDKDGKIIIPHPYKEDYQKLIRGSKNGILKLNLNGAAPALINFVSIMGLDKRPNSVVVSNTGSEKKDIESPTEQKATSSHHSKTKLNKIEKVKIQNFKSIKEIETNLNRINVFVGGNNAGKSSFLQAIQFAIGIAQTAQHQELGNTKDNKLVFCADSTSFMYSPTSDLNSLIRGSSNPLKNEIKISFSTDEIQTDISLRHKLNNSFKASITNTPFYDAIKLDDSPFCVYITGLSGLPLTEEFKSKAKVLKSATRGDSNLYLRNILWLLHENGDKSKWDTFLKRFCCIYHDYSLDISFSPETDEVINVYAIKKEKGRSSSSIRIPLDMLGTGALQTIQILSYISYFTPSILILDEPDTHLHPTNQKLLFNVLKDYSNNEGTQILIATHSRHIIEKAAGEKNTSIFWLNNGNRIKELSFNSNLEIITMFQDIGESKLSDISNPELKYIIFTEDEKTEKAGYLQAILEASGIPLCSVAIVPYLGCSKKDSILTAKKLLNNFNSNLKIIVHRDRDYLTKEEQSAFRNSFSRNEIRVWFTPGSDLEAVFINEKHIKKCYPDLSDDFISKAVQLSYKSAKDSSLKRLREHKKEIERKKQKESGYIVNSEINDVNFEELYDNNPGYYCYGKKTLGYLKSILQKALHKNINLIRPSIHITQEELSNLLSDTSKNKKTEC